MDVTIKAALIGVASGAMGYWIATFYIQPILRYRELKSKVHQDFIYYAQVVNADGFNEDMQDLYKERWLANRKSSAMLSSIIVDLPCLYAWYLKTIKKQNLGEAARNLIGYANNKGHGHAHQLEQRICKNLGLPYET